ncbi:MAG: efflux RND transporter periplasmic adaptor subunit, partial [Gammaproteobacteria bacterium]|nr:efflux RND transporter periplasmic adaptor subunit [Gammaproteobacteria bacterium]
DAEAAWKTASAKQSVIEEELKAAKLKLERLKIMAPFDGLITSITVQEGQWVTTALPLLNIVDMEQRMAELKVDVSDSGNLMVGQKVTITSDAFSGQKWTEKITKISSEASREDSANIVKVQTSLDSSPDELRIGQRLDAKISTASRSNTLRIPFNVIFTHNGRPHVAVIENAKIKFVPVVLGIESSDYVEVLDGVRAGQELVIPGSTPLEEGMSVVTQ